MKNFAGIDHFLRIFSITGKWANKSHLMFQDSHIDTILKKILLEIRTTNHDKMKRKKFNS